MAISNAPSARERSACVLTSRWVVPEDERLGGGRVHALLAELARVGVVSREQFEATRVEPSLPASLVIPHDDMMTLLVALPDRAGPDAVRTAILAYHARHGDPARRGQE